MILGIMWTAPSKVRLDASTPRERPGRPSRRRVRVRARPERPGRPGQIRWYFVPRVFPGMLL